MKAFFSHFAKVIAVWLIGFVTFTGTLPKTPDKLPNMADAIVVLTGDSYRISAGFDLYQHGVSEKLFISGVYPGTNMVELARPYLPAEQLDGIELDDKATNTRENAVETTKWIRKNQYKSIVLVTSNYHMRRAWIHFQNHMPDLAITPYAVSSSKKHWTTSYKGIRTMVRAYNKLLVTLPIILIQKTTSL